MAMELDLRISISLSIPVEFDTMPRFVVYCKLFRPLLLFSSLMSSFAYV